jgi:hypothetical protein
MTYFGFKSFYETSVPKNVPQFYDYRESLCKCLKGGAVWVAVQSVECRNRNTPNDSLFQPINIFPGRRKKEHRHGYFQQISQNERVKPIF